MIELYVEEWDAITDLIDLKNALLSADLTEIEWAVIEALYIKDPIPPERDRPSRDGSTRGRPRGGSNYRNLAMELFPDAVSENAAFMKFKKVRNRGIAKLRDSLYEGVTIA